MAYRTNLVHAFDILQAIASGLNQIKMLKENTQGMY